MWETDGSDSISEQVRLAVEARANERAGGRSGRDEEFRPSKVPQTEEERMLYEIFKQLKAKNHNLIEKRRIAADVLNGKHGMKKQLHAKFLLGPRDFESVLNDPRDIVPELVALVGNNDIDVGVKAAKVLGKRGDERALFVMCGRLDEERYWARFEFKRAFRKMVGNINDLDVLQRAAIVLEAKGEGSAALRLVRSRIQDLSPVERAMESRPPAALARGGRIQGGMGDKVASARPERPDTTLKMFVNGKGKK